MCKVQVRSLTDLILHFNTEEKCIKHLESIRWPEGDVYCPRCFKSNSYRFKDGVTYKCSSGHCGKKFNVKTNSIFQSSNIPLQKWFLAIYLFSSHKKGISSIQMSKDLGLTQSTAWKMLHKIRGAFTEPIIEKIFGTIEIDETFVGGKNKNRHKDKKVPQSQGRSFKDKTPVLGMICRETKKAYTYVIPSTSRENIQPILFQTIAPGSSVMTDEWKAYQGISSVFNHNFIRHDQKQYADGDTYTNNIEGFWSHLKRGIIGVYHKTSRKHLQAYCDEFTFRYNTRFMSEGERLNKTLENIYRA